MPTNRNLWVVLTMLLMAACTVPVIPAAPAPDAWRTFRADSGYEISYPVGAYSMRIGLSRADVLFPGLKVVEPNDSFFYQEPRSATYKLSIAVTVNVDNWTLDDAESLLTNSAIIDYDPEMLAGKTIQQTTLGGEPALRVDALPAGPAGITSQIVAIHGPFIYELMVEPHLLTGNQAEPFIEPAPSAKNRALIEEIIATFRFVGEETLVETPPATPVTGELQMGAALVDAVDVQMLESFPVQVNVLVRGYLQDACTEMGEIRQQFDGSVFTIELTTVRDPNLMCAQVLTPFEQTIPLEVAGLPSGAYTLIVNGVTAQFELAVDNAPAGATTLLEWEGYTEMGDGDASVCKHLTLTTDQATFGVCAGEPETQPFPGNTMSEWADIQTNFAPFILETAQDRLQFNGQGGRAGEAWQRALLAWTHFTYGQLASGRVSAAGRTALSWHFGEIAEQPGQCLHLTVLVYGYAYVEQRPCAGGEPQILGAGWLTDEEITQFDALFYSHAPLYEGDNYLDGRGEQEWSEAEIGGLAGWAEQVQTRLAMNGVAGVPAACAAPFDTVKSMMATTVQETVAAFEPPAEGELMLMSWDAEVWQAIVDQLVAAGEHFLNECGGDAPVTPVLDQLARLSQVIPPLTITIPGEGDFLPLEITLANTVRPSASLVDVDGDGEGEVLLHTQVAYFDGEQILFGLRGGVSILFDRVGEDWQGHLIWPIPHYVPLATDYLEFAPFREEVIAQERDWSAAQALIEDPAPVVEPLNLTDAAGNHYLAVSHIRRGPVDDIRQLAVLRLRAGRPEVALRIVLDNWCVQAGGEIDEQGVIHLPALPEPFPHCQGEYTARTFSLVDGHFVMQEQ
jgi:hypothetical protein